MEVELKLLFAAHDADTLRRHPLLQEYATAQPREQTLTDTYFDTPDLRLRQSAARLRVRKVDNTWVETMHGGSRTGAREWHAPLAGPAPDLAALRDVVGHNSASGKLLRLPLLEDRLAPIFTTRVKRMVWALCLPQGDEVECVLEQGRLECAGMKVPISEIELELKSGQPAHLFDFALALQQDIPLQIGQLSQAERGYALFAPQPPAAFKATPLKLSKHMNIEQAFQAIALNCLAQIQANEAAVVEAHDVEGVHQMRVGLRRLRSALGLFKDVFQAPDDMQQELDWLTTQLGAARDWDVLATATLPALAAAAPAEPRLAGLMLAAHARADDKHEAAALAVASARHARLILSLRRWVLGCGWRDAMLMQDGHRLAAPLGGFARKTLLQRQRRLFDRARQLRAASPETRHRLRIAAKKTRYASEFFQSLFSARTLRPYVAALSALQDEFGWLNDASVGSRLLQELQEGQAELDAGAGFARGYLLARSSNDDRKIHKLWHDFAAMKLPR